MNAKNLSTYLVAVALASLLCDGAVGAENTPAIAESVGPSSALASAAYARTCAYCHKAEGGAPLLFGRNLTEAYIKAQVRLGPNGMPAFRPTEISDAELKALATMISTSKTPKKTN